MTKRLTTVSAACALAVTYSTAVGASNASVCVACTGANSYSQPGATECSTCPLGTVLVVSTTNSTNGTTVTSYCADCSPGTYRTATETLCTECDPGRCRGMAFTQLSAATQLQDAYIFLNPACCGDSIATSLLMQKQADLGIFGAQSRATTDSRISLTACRHICSIRCYQHDLHRSAGRVLRPFGRHNHSYAVRARHLPAIYWQHIMPAMPW